MDKTIEAYRHKCKRCKKTWVSLNPEPIACGKCKSPYWRTKPKATLAVAEAK